MRIGDDVSIHDLPRQPTPSSWASLEHLAWRLGLSRRSTRITDIRSDVEEDFTVSIQAATAADLTIDPGHFLSATKQYVARRFLVAKAKDLMWSRNAKAIIAPPWGAIDELNVGGASAIPEALLHADFAPGVSTRRSGRVERVPGLSIPLCHYGMDAFGHFVLDGLLQVFLHIEALDSGRAKLAHWPLQAPWMARLLDACGITADRRHELHRPLALFETAGVSSALAGHGVYFPACYSHDFFAWLKSRLVQSGLGGAGPPARIYVRRSAAGSRKIMNQSALEALLQTHGFRVLDASTQDVLEQARAFATAEIAVSAWGSGLTLAPLMTGRRQVIELTPQSVTDVWFLRQATVHGLDYTPILHASNDDGDIVADLPLIDAVLRRSNA